VKLLQIKLANTYFKLKDSTVFFVFFHLKYFAKADFYFLCYS